MTELVLMAITGSVVSIMLLMVAMLIRLWQRLKKLEQDHALLDAQIQRGSDDVAGLCSAAVAVDRRLSVNEARLNNLFDAVGTQQQTQVQQPVTAIHDEEPQGYDQAIQKIRRGAGIDELVKSCGLTRDEAMLLVRLHGKAG